MNNKISAVIITYNEEKNIENCLKSLKKIADEIIILDSFSTDKTCEIAKKFGAKVEQRKFDDYSSQKNAAQSFTQYDYILSIDADEALSEALVEEILTEKNKNLTCFAYNLPRLTSYCGQWIYHCGWYPDRAVRLWRKDLGIWEGVVHEKITGKALENIGFLKNPILHYSFPTLSTHLKKVDLYSTISAEEMFKKGKKTHWIYAFLSAWFTFVKKYFFQLGFLDGYVGFLVCYFSALSNFLKYNKLYFLYKEHENKLKIRQKS